MASSPLSAYEVTTIDRDVAQLGILLDPARGFMAVEHGQLDVHEDQIRPLGLGQPHARLAVHGLDQLVAGAHQQITDDPPVVLLILDDEDALGHAASSRSPTRSGSVK